MFLLPVPFWPLLLCAGLSQGHFTLPPSGVLPVMVWSCATSSICQGYYAGAWWFFSLLLFFLRFLLPAVFTKHTVCCGHLPDGCLLCHPGKWFWHSPVLSLPCSAGCTVSACWIWGETLHAWSRRVLCFLYVSYHLFWGVFWQKRIKPYSSGCPSLCQDLVWYSCQCS